MANAARGHMPPMGGEDQRYLHRVPEILKHERAAATTRIKGLLSSQGIRLKSLMKLPEQLDVQ